MKRCKVYLLIMLLICTAMARSQSISSDNNPEFACPNVPTSYILNMPSGAITQFVKWTVSNGSFSPSSEVTTQNSLYDAIVYWKNVSYNGNTPSGELKVEVTYLQGSTQYIKTAKITQKIKSYTNVTPPKLESKTISPIDFGVINIEVYLKDPFYLPYVDSKGYKFPVTKFEWTLPNGWADKYGNKGTFTTDKPSINIVTDELSMGVVKVRGVSDCNLYEYTNYSQITINRKFSFTDYPKEIKYGESKVYTYTVQQVAGIQYQWDFPSGWSISSGGSGNTISLLKSAGATDATVRVKLKKGSNESDWYKCPNSTIIPPDINIPSDATQFSDIIVSTSVPSANIKSFTISGAGIETISGQGSNSLVCCFNNEGNIEAMISLTLNGSDTPYIFKKNITIKKFELTLTSPFYMCPYGTQLIFPEISSKFKKRFTIKPQYDYVFRGSITENGYLTYEPNNGLVGYILIQLELLKDDQVVASASTSPLLRTHTLNGHYHIEGSDDAYKFGSFPNPILANKRVKVTINNGELYGTSIKSWRFDTLNANKITMLSAYSDQFEFITYAEAPTAIGMFFTIDWGCCIRETSLCRFVIGKEYPDHFIIPDPFSKTIQINEVESSVPSITNESSEPLNYELREMTSGSIMKKGILLEKKNTVDVSNLSNGFYVVRIFTDEFSKSYKVKIANK